MEIMYKNYQQHDIFFLIILYGSLSLSLKTCAIKKLG